MKALILSNRNDFRLHSLVAPLQQIMEVGFMKKYDKHSFDAYKPDIILSDEMHHTPDAYDLKNLGSLAPFINYAAYKAAIPEVCERYKSDVSYMGPVSDMDSILLTLHRKGHNVRHYHQAPSMSACYAGYVDMDRCYVVYKNASVSLIPAKDIGFRELDIIVSDGNPLHYMPGEKFIKLVEAGISGQKFKHKISKSDVLMKHTNYERLGEVLTELGFGAVARKIKQDKQ